jgi:hypothetical protein
VTCEASFLLVAGRIGLRAMNVEVCRGDDLTIGSKAPSIDIEHWVQTAAVNSLL